MQHILIVGGSIGGLAAALALHQQGWKVSLYERFSKERIGGAALGLPSQSKDILHLLGIPLEKITSLLRPSSYVHMDVTRRVFLEEKRATWTTYWSYLYKLILEYLPSEIIYWDSNVVKCETFKSNQGSWKVRIFLDHDMQKPVEGDFLVAADGAFSTIRNQILPNVKPVYSGYISWRGIVNRKDFTKDEEWEKLNKLVFDSYPQCKNCVIMIYSNPTPTTSSLFFLIKLYDTFSWHWYLNAPSPPDGKFVTTLPTPHAYKEFLDQVSKTYDQAIMSLIQATPNPFITSVHDLNPLDEWIYGEGKNILFIGDASHCTRPHLGLATGMAIKDGYYLGKILGAPSSIPNKGDFDTKLKEFVELRKYECNAVLLRSRERGNVSQGLANIKLPVWKDVTSSSEVTKKVATSGELVLETIQALKAKSLASTSFRSKL